MRLFEVISVQLPAEDNQIFSRSASEESGDEVMEGRVKDYAMAGIAAASLAGAVSNSHRLQNDHERVYGPETTSQSIELPGPSAQHNPDEYEALQKSDEEYETGEPELEKLAGAIAKKYRVSQNMVNDIVALAHHYEDDVFPKAIDILAVIAVESSFNPRAVSQLRRDPARGLMQVRPGVWGIDPNDLATIEQQIRAGAKILKHYYQKTKSAEGALHAYNMGITNYRRGKTNPRYVNKVDIAKRYFASYLL